MILEIRQYPKVVVTLRIADYTFQPQALFDAGGKCLLKTLTTLPRISR
jgi:hypothetical protein